MLTITPGVWASLLGVDRAEPRVQPRRVELGQLHHLGADAQAAARGEVRDAELALVRAAALPGRAVVGLAPRSTAARRSRGSSPTSPRCARCGSARAPRSGSPARSDSTKSTISSSLAPALVVDEVHERVRVRGDEVHRPVREALVGQRHPDRRPPAARQPRVAGLRAAEHPQAQLELVRADLVRRTRPARRARTRAGASSPPRSRRRPRRRRAAPAPPAAPPRAAARAACSTRAGRRRASGSRRRGPRSRRAGPPSCP